MKDGVLGKIKTLYNFTCNTQCNVFYFHFSYNSTGHPDFGDI